MTTETAHREAFNLLTGELISYGSSRSVYACPMLPDCVVKVETAAQRFQNVVEWETWERIKGTAASQWFAACHFISPCGTILLMARTRPASPAEFPDKVPVYLTDLKRSNYGIVDKFNGPRGKSFFVCHDYGTHALFEHGMSKRMRKAEWWDLDFMGHMPGGAS